MGRRGWSPLCWEFTSLSSWIKVYIQNFMIWAFGGMIDWNLIQSWEGEKKLQWKGLRHCLGTWCKHRSSEEVTFRAWEAIWIFVCVWFKSKMNGVNWGSPEGSEKSLLNENIQESFLKEEYIWESLEGWWVGFKKSPCFCTLISSAQNTFHPPPLYTPSGNCLSFKPSSHRTVLFTFPLIWQLLLCLW